MKTTQLSSGLIVPAEEEKPKPQARCRDYGAIEITDDNLRRDISRHFSDMLNKLCRHGLAHIQEPDRYNNQYDATLKLAYRLLGHDWSYEQLC